MANEQTLIEGQLSRAVSFRVLVTGEATAMDVTQLIARLQDKERELRREQALHRSVR